jgi:hypothetical protein
MAMQRGRHVLGQLGLQPVLHGQHMLRLRQTNLEVKAPMKCRLFMWLVVHRRCLTANNHQKRNWPHTPVCVLCQAADEDCTHLFLHCRYT